MAKTCRTCVSLQAYCHVAGVLPPCGGSFGCELYAKRETPLLVDELGEALKELLDENVLYEIAQQANTFLNEPIVNLVENVVPKVIATLARYQKEVGDAEA